MLMRLPSYLMLKRRISLRKEEKRMWLILTGLSLGVLLLLAGFRTDDGGEEVIEKRGG